MTIHLDERFEDATDYDDANWTENPGTNNTIDPNDDPVDVNTPAGWGIECLSLDAVTITNLCAIKNTGFGDLTKSYVRFDTVLDTDSFGNNQSGVLAFANRSVANGGLHAYRIYWNRDGSGNLRFLMGMILDGSTVTYTNTSALGALSTGTKYTVEIEWDAGTSAGWRVNGTEIVDYDSGDFTAGYAVDIGQLWLGNVPGLGTAAAYKTYIDRVAIDDSTWPDTEGAKPHIIHAYKRING